MLGFSQICLHNIYVKNTANKMPYIIHNANFVHRVLLLLFYKSEKATLQLFIFCEKVLGKNVLSKLNYVSQTSSKRFVETSSIRLV